MRANQKNRQKLLQSLQSIAVRQKTPRSMLQGFQVYASSIAYNVFFTCLNFSQVPIICQLYQVRIAFSKLNVYEATFKVLLYYLRKDRLAGSNVLLNVS